jgi:cell pole-organizing protein PopZ
MSAASPKVQDKAQEPSMEEILASIRRIIADDQIAKAEEAQAPRVPAPENDDVLDLAEVAQPARKPEPAPFEEPEIAFRSEPSVADEIDFDAISFDDEPEPEPEPPPPPKAVRQEAPQPAPRPVYEPDPFEASPTERLTSAVTDASVAQAFSMLSNTVLSANARTLEDLVQDMLRPMLKAWLDDNLPVMVERLVRAEIERVARGR